MPRLRDSESANSSRGDEFTQANRLLFADYFNYNNGRDLILSSESERVNAFK